MRAVLVGKMGRGISTTVAAGVIVSVLIVGAVAAVGYFQFNVAPSVFSSTTSTTSTSAGLPPPGKYVNVTIPVGAASPPGPGYGPATITLVMGINNTVVWTNADPAIHTVTASDNSFNSNNMNEGAIFTYKFSTPGTYTYRCIYHSWMSGTVVVKSG